MNSLTEILRIRQEILTVQFLLLKLKTEISNLLRRSLYTFLPRSPAPLLTLLFLLPFPSLPSPRSPRTMEVLRMQ